MCAASVYVIREMMSQEMDRRFCVGMAQMRTLQLFKKSESGRSGPTALSSLRNVCSCDRLLSSYLLSRLGFVRSL